MNNRDALPRYNVLRELRATGSLESTRSILDKPDSHPAKLWTLGEPFRLTRVRQPKGKFDVVVGYRLTPKHLNSRTRSCRIDSYREAGSNRFLSRDSVQMFRTTRELP